MFYGKNRDIFGIGGFTMVEILIAIAIVSVAFMAMSGTTISVIHGNNISRNSTDGIINAQAVIEDLRNRMFYLGADGILGFSATGTDDKGADNSWSNDWDDNGDDLISSRLVDPDCGSSTANNKCTTTPDDTDTAVSTVAQLFANPDYDSNGNINPTITINKTPQVVWNIRDNSPLSGVKNVLVIVGWQEGGSNRYVTMSTTIAGWRHEGEPYTK